LAETTIQKIAPHPAPAQFITKRYPAGAIRASGAPSQRHRARPCSVRQVNMTISLAFLAPNLVKAAVEGRLPRGIGVERLRDPPTEWSRQFEALGLNPE
jgi:hypothetical protein